MGESLSLFLGGFGMTPWCVVLVCSWRRLLADRHSLPFPWTLSLHGWWCPSASHHPVTFLFPPALTFPLYFPFLSLDLSLHRPWYPSASHHSFPFHSLGQLCQRSPRTCPVSLLCVESTQRKANALAVGQVRPSGHPKPAVRYLSPTAGSGPRDVHLRGRFPSKFPCLVLPLASATRTPYPLLYAFAAHVASPFPCMARTGVGCGGCCGVGQVPWLASHLLARLPGPPPHRSELLLG